MYTTANIWDIFNLALHEVQYRSSLFPWGSVFNVSIPWVLVHDSHVFVFWQILDSLGLYMTDDQFRILSAR